MISALLLVLLVAAVWVAYREVRESALVSSRQHLQRVTDELADISVASLTMRERALRAVAQSHAVRSYARTPSIALAATTLSELQSLRVPADSLFVVELWNARGEHVLGIGPPAAGTDGRRGGVRPGVPMLADSAVVSPFFPLDGRTHYWSIVPVLEGAELLGYVAQLRLITAQPGTDQRIRDLTGAEVTVYYTDADGTVWSNINGQIVPAPVAIRGMPDTFDYEREGAGQFLIHKARVGSTPLHILLEMPLAAVLARPNAFLRRFALIGLVLLVAGALLAWALSRSVTAPIAQLTTAAASIARGEYSRRAPVQRDDEIGRLSTAFNTMAERVEQARADQQRQFEAAQAANRAKSDFVATMSHEIRTPINAMIGYTDLLDLEISGPITEQQRAQLARIRTSGRHLISLVNEVLDLAKIESGSMRVGRTAGRIGHAADTAIALAGPQALAKSITLTDRANGQPDALYVGEQQRVEQILANLLSNAVKFTKPGGTVRVHCHTERHGPRGAHDPGEWTCVTVEDSGVGIQDEQLERIFEPFVQGDSGYTRTQSGTGLGLAISRRLAHMMGGELTVTSQPGVGSRFTLWLQQPSPTEDGT